jgi:hypothetical protein
LAADNSAGVLARRRDFKPANKEGSDHARPRQLQHGVEPSGDWLVGTVYDSYIVKRTQIYLDDGQNDELARRAAAEGLTKSALIRRAVDEYLDADGDDDLGLARFKAAVEAVAGAAPDLPPGSVYVERLRALDVSRQEEIERRRRA